MWDSLFLIPFLTGLGFAILLPVLGVLLRLRQEWLAALAYAHVAAAGALLALAVEVPLLLGGGVLALAAAALKRPLARYLAGQGSGRHENATVYAVLLIVGWLASVLLTANLPMAERLGHALFDGQLYFTGPPQLFGAVVWGAVACLLLRRWQPRLLLARLYPDYFRARGQASWPVDLGFDLLAAASLALATMSLGVMGAFSLLFVPPWLAFAVARDWRQALRFSLLCGVAAYGLAFLLALWLDQPFGPVLAACCLALAGVWHAVHGRVARRGGV